MKVTDVFIEEEVEYEMRQLIGVVKKTLETLSSLDWNLDIIMWRTPFYDVKVARFFILFSLEFFLHNFKDDFFLLAFSLYTYNVLYRI